MLRTPGDLDDPTTQSARSALTPWTSTKTRTDRNVKTSRGEWKWGTDETRVKEGATGAGEEEGSCVVRRTVRGPQERGANPLFGADSWRSGGVGHRRGGLPVRLSPTLRLPRLATNLVLLAMSTMPHQARGNVGLGPWKALRYEPCIDWTECDVPTQASPTTVFRSRSRVRHQRDVSPASPITG